VGARTANCFLLICDDLLLSDSEQLIKVHGLASPSLIWQLSFVIMNKQGAIRHEGESQFANRLNMLTVRMPIGPFGGSTEFGVWPGLVGFQASGNIVAFGGSTDSSMIFTLNPRLYRF
jgi:hypothetical protein